MRLSEFTDLAEEVFGPGYAASVITDVVVTELDQRTARQALDQGVPVAQVWAALCGAMDVPPSRRWGQLRRQAPRREGR